MTGVDIVILLIIGISAVISLIRGIFREIISLAAWLFAILLTFSYSKHFATILPEAIEGPTARLAVSAVTLFVCTLFIGGLINFLLQKFLSKANLGGLDRFFGSIFGVIRGVLIVSLLVLLAHLTPLPQEDWWHEAQLLPRFQGIAVWMYEWLPPELADYFEFTED